MYVFLNYTIRGRRSKGEREVKPWWEDDGWTEEGCRMGLSVSWETSVAQGLKTSPQMSMRNFLISAAGPWMR